MTGRYRIRGVRRKIGYALAALGTIIWAVSGTLRFETPDEGDVSIPHFEARALGVICGGAVVARGIVLLAIAV
jgi:hypothetical protein